MKTPELETISIFSKDLTLNLTINQISKELNKSYAFTNKYIREFLSQGILTKKVVGSAILCSLNFTNENTLGLLMMNSIHNKIEFVNKAPKKLLNEFNIIKNIPSIKSILYSKSKFIIICEDKKIVDKHVKGFKGLSVTLLDQNEFQLNMRGLDLDKTIIMEGYEAFWKLISEVML